MVHFLSPNMNLDGIVILIVGIMLGPAILLVILGLMLVKSNNKVAKVLFILAAVYLIVSFGVCGVILSGGL